MKPKEWLTVTEAAFLTQRHASRIYRWIDTGMVKWTVDAKNTIVVSSVDVMRIASVVKPGRPKTRREAS